MTQASTPEEIASSWQDSMIEEGFANLRRYSAMPFIAEKARKVRKGVTPSEVVYEEDKARLMHYVSDREPK